MARQNKTSGCLLGCRVGKLEQLWFGTPENMENTPI